MGYEGKSEFLYVVEESDITRVILRVSLMGQFEMIKSAVSENK